MLPIFHAIVDEEERRETNKKLREKRSVLREELDLSGLSEERFKELFRIDKNLFQFLRLRITPFLREPKYASGVGIETKILVTVRFFATGCYQRSVGGDFNLGVSQTIAHRCIHELTNAINDQLEELNPHEGSPEARYNRSHILARNCVERCIGVLKARFRCLLKERVARYAANFVGKLVNACCILHNLCIEMQIIYEGEPIQEDDEDDHQNNHFPLHFPLPNQNVPNLRLRQGEAVRRHLVNTYFVR